MAYKRTKGNEIAGILDVFVSHNEAEENGEIVKWDEVLIHGNPEGLKSLAKLLLEIAELNQEDVPHDDLPVGASETQWLGERIDIFRIAIKDYKGQTYSS